METPILEIDPTIAAIQNITIAGSPYKVLFTATSIYLLSLGGTDIMEEMIVVRLLGLIGKIISHFISKQDREEKLDNINLSDKSPDQLVQEDHKSAKINYDEIEKYQTMNRFSHLQGKRPILIWAKGLQHVIYMPKGLYEEALSLLEQKCPGKKSA